MSTSNNGIPLIILIVLNLIFFTFNFYEGVSRSNCLSFVLAGTSMTAVLFCVWVIGFTYAIRKVKKTIPTRHICQRNVNPTFVEIKPLSIKKSDIDRFVVKKVEKTKQQRWNEYQRENK